MRPLIRSYANMKLRGPLLVTRRSKSVISSLRGKSWPLLGATALSTRLFGFRPGRDRLRQVPAPKVTTLAGGCRYIRAPTFEIEVSQVVKSADLRPIWSRPLFNLNLRAWRRLESKYGKPTDRRLRTRILIQGALVSAIEKLQEVEYGDKIAGLPLEGPVFVLGHWRSGTTLLHEILALDSRLVAPTTYQCFNPHSFLLSVDGLVHRDVPIVRPSGDRLVSSASPQEEEFALLCRGATSPYESVIFPSALARIGSLSDFREYSESDQKIWEDVFVSFLKGISYRAKGRRLLLKSPSNTFRLPTLSRLFPDAAFVQIVREPTAVVLSAVETWTRMWARYALSPEPTTAALEELVIDAYLAMDAKVTESIGSLAHHRALTIRYEELVGSPYETVEHIYGALNLGKGELSKTRIDELLKSGPPLRGARQPTPAQIAAVRKRCEEIYTRYNYG
jgi:omega-hydroxy-beta-dihydromenaquinone-9 sulfotransferase